MEQKRGKEKQRFEKRRGKLGHGMDALKRVGEKGGEVLQPPYETIMFTSTL